MGQSWQVMCRDIDNVSARFKGHCLKGYAFTYKFRERGIRLKNAQKTTAMIVLSCLLLGMAGCASKPQESAAPAAAPAVNEPAAPAENPSTGQQDPPAAPTEPSKNPAVKPNATLPPNASGEPATAVQQPSLILGRGRDEGSGQVTQADTKFKAGEQFYYGFNNGVPFGASSILLQYESAQSGEVINKYSITVDPAQTYNWAAISFKEPGQYKLVFMVNNTIRASQTFTIE